MTRHITVVLLCLGLALCSECFAQNMLTNGSFESNLSGWTAGSVGTIAVRSSGWSGVTAADGSKFLAVSGPASVGYSYAPIVTQSLSAPFGAGIPSDNILLWLAAQTYLHTNDGRQVSYALILEPGYGAMGYTFHGGSRDEWVNAQTSGNYAAYDPFDSSLPVKPIKVYLELREPLQSGEYLLFDNVQLYYEGPTMPEPASAVTLLCGVMATVVLMRRRR
jgi:hypothetical protein